MKKNSLLSAFVFSSLLFSSVNAQAREKIVGGVQVTDPNEARYMVSLSGSCGGSIISSKWVLTAAHCAGYFSEVKGGVLNLKEEGLKLRVKRVIKHPKYDRYTFSYDFALVELDGEFDLINTNLRAVKLADEQFEQDGHQNPGMDSTVYGFGNIRQGQSNSSKNLNKVVIPIVSNEDANHADSYDGAIDETMLAAGFTEGGKNSCQGDSGGPLVVFDHQNEPVQIGVVSWGEGCALANKYGIYSRVSLGNKWITETINQ